jgi:hypothetical protein
MATLVTARLFLDLLGRGKRGGRLVPFEPKADDIVATELGGTLLDPTTLSQAERDLFLDFLIMADKAAAHFTVPIKHDWSKTHDVILRIINI